MSYGHFSLWAWASEREPVGEAIRRQSEYTLEPWWSVLATPGAESMTILRRYFESGDWWTLRPAQDLLAEQPGDEDARRFIAAARTLSGIGRSSTSRSGGTIHLQPELQRTARRAGSTLATAIGFAAEPATATAERLSFTAPSD